MSIIVKGMEMPEDCGVCYRETNCFGTGRFQEDGCVWCGLAKGYLGVEETRSKCPIRPLPEKHGRLIDASELETVAKGRLGVINIGHIDEMRTIVEAEGD